ncbi:hypothetical protein BDV06DRAFT_168716 [Aspergillus oleicola]
MGVDLQDPDEQRSPHVHPPMNVALATPLFVLGGSFLILFIARLISTIRHNRRLKSVLRDENQNPFTRENSLTSLFKKHILYAPLFSTRHSREFRLGRLHMGTVPLRIETLLLTGYIGINLAFFVCIVDWWEDREELLYQLKYAAGHLAVMNTPGLVLTAGRNNPLIWMLGIQFDVFNLLHRWVGRLIVVGAIVHVAGVVAGKVEETNFETATNIFWHVPFFVYGMIALIGFVAILLQSVSPLRHAFYEVFLHLHILLAVMSFVGLWYHLRGLTQQYVLLGTIILWGLERFARLLSLLWRNIGKDRTTATVELLPGQVARVNVSLARDWSFSAGQYMYLYIPSLGLWTSHPFSVAWASSGEENGLTDQDKQDSSDSFNLLLAKSERRQNQSRRTVSFLIKRKEGFTCKLLNKAVDAEECCFRAAAFAEGPFGGLHSLNSYGTVLLIAGGVGITHPMSYMHQFVEAFSNRTTAVRRVHLIWAVRSKDHLSWIQPWMTSLFTHPAIASKESNLSLSPSGSSSETNFQAITQNRNLDVKIQIFVTTRFATDDSIASSTSPLSSDTSSPSDSASRSNFNALEQPWAYTFPPTVCVSIIDGKPCFAHILQSEQRARIGAMAVSVCGPGGMGDDVRGAFRRLSDGSGSGTGRKGAGKVDLYEETFSW